MKLAVEIIIQTSLIKNVSLKKMPSEKNLTNLSQMPVIDSLDDNFQLVTDCSCKQMHNLFPTIAKSLWFHSMARSSSLCSKAGLKCDQEEKQNGAQE